MTEIYVGRNFREHILDPAEREAEQRGFYDFPIVDTDAHHMDTPITELEPYLAEPWRSRLLAMRSTEIIPHDVGDRHVDGRTKRPKVPRPEGEMFPKCVYHFKVTQRKLGIDISIVFPTDMLALGLHPDQELEVAMARAYAHWIVERVCPYEPGIKTMLYLPFSDPEASLKMVEDFGDKPGVVGFMVTSLRHQQVHQRPYLKVYAALQERGLPLGFHSISHWRERPFELFNNFLSAHALGFPFYNSMHLVNVVLNGLPERFPRLQWIFFEAGLAWIPMLIYRLDHIFMRRRSDMPALKRKPSEYIRQFYFSTQPFEQPQNMRHFQALIDLVGASQFIYSSDYPHWDFDAPNSIYNIPFLSEEEKRGILGANAIRLFKLEDAVKEVVARRAQEKTA